MSVFKLLESLKKSDPVKQFEKTTAGRHSEAPGKPQPTMTKPVPNREHIRADTQTHLDLKLEKAAGFHASTGATGVSALAKATQWHVKIKGLEGYHPLKNIKDLGPEKGNNYILHDGREFHQNQVEDMKPAKLNKNNSKPDPNLIAWQQGNEPSSTRDLIKPIPQKHRKALLDHIAAKTKTRINNGKREFLLHRGVSPDEYDTEQDKIEGAVYHNPQYSKNTSWTTSKPTAESFAQNYAEEGKKPKVFSAWVHEDAIVNSPSFYNKDYQKEHEVIVGSGHYHPIARIKKGMEVLRKPFKSEAQRRFFHWAASHGKKGITKEMVHHWEAATGKKKLPEHLEKAAPKYIGEVDPEKDYIAVPHPHNPKMPVWQHNPTKAKFFQDKIDQNLDKFTSQFGQNGQVLKNAILKGISNKKHIDLVPTALKYDEIHTPRRRHFAGLLDNNPSSRIKDLGNGEFLWFQDRHGEGGRLPETWWKINHQGIQDVTKQHLSRFKDFFQKSDKSYVSEKKGDLYALAKSIRNSILQRTRGTARFNSIRNDNPSASGSNDNVLPKGYSGYGTGISGNNGTPQKSWNHGLLKKSVTTPPKKLTKSNSPQVASIAVIDGDHLLMGRRNDNQRWTLPGGHLEAGEDPLTGAHRELLEETGIDIPSNEIQYLGSEQVTTFTGKKIIVHCFATFGRYDTDSELDPDQEVQHWHYIDVTHGLPEEISENLHSPKNVLLQKIGIL